MARKGDWDITQMPIEHTPFELDLTISSNDFFRIMQGLIPASISDRWFIYYKDNWLYLHRSWTGHCIFQLRFQEREGNYKVVGAIANRHKQQYKSNDITLDAEIIKLVLFSQLIGKPYRLSDKFQEVKRPFSRAWDIVGPLRWQSALVVNEYVR